MKKAAQLLTKIIKQWGEFVIMVDLNEIFQRAKQREAEELAANPNLSTCGVCFFHECTCTRKLQPIEFETIEPIK